jgi:hypothetical protein
MWQHVISESAELDLESPQLTRVRRMPRNLEQTASVIAPCQYNNVKTRHKIHCLQLADLLVDRRFDQPETNKLLVIARMLTRKAEPGDVKHHRQYL